MFDLSSNLSLILSLSLAWLINQAKSSQAKPRSSFLVFPQAQVQTPFLGLSRDQAKFKHILLDKARLVYNPTGLGNLLGPLSSKLFFFFFFLVGLKKLF